MSGPRTTKQQTTCCPPQLGNGRPHTHTNGDINCCKWFQAVAAWVQFEVDLILFSEMQPSEATSDTPDAPYILEYNAEPKRIPGKGTGAAFNRSLLESSTKLYIPNAPKQFGF